jgi:glycosyltransferase involved in cell wall biosynthesis
MEIKRIHLLFIVNSLGYGGAEKHVVTLANKLDTSRFKLSLAYLKAEVDLIPQLDIARFGGRIFCCNVTKRFDGQAVRRLADHIRDEKVHVLVCTNEFSLLYGWLARITAGLRPRVVAVFHSTQLNTTKDKLQMLFYRPLFWLSDMLVYVCENQKTFWKSRALWARQEAVIHNGIDTDLFDDRYTQEAKSSLRKCYGFHPDDFVVGLCALIRPEKAHVDLLRAVRILRQAGLNVKCLLIGDGPQRLQVEERIASLGLASHVGITGLLSDVRPSVAACSVMALVSHQETFSISALESMALGKAMIMSAIGGAKGQIVHGEDGYLYERGDITGLVDALLRLMESGNRTRLGARARSKVVLSFSVGAMVEAYDRLFVRVAQGNG